MPGAITAEQQREHDRLLDGEIFKSEAPIKLAAFDPADAQVIMGCTFRKGYSEVRLSSWFEMDIVDENVLTAVLNATSLFSRCSRGPRITRFAQMMSMDIETRYGMFAKGMLRGVDVAGFHVDN